MTPAELIAANLGSLVHPGEGKTGPTPITLPMFRTVSNAAMQEHFAAEAGLPHPDINRLVAEAIVALVEGNGYAIVANQDLAGMKAATAAAEPARNRRLNFQCRCGYPIFTAQVDGFDTDHPTLPPAAIKAMHSIGADCNTGHAVLHLEPHG
jgi:hypothetical protein